MKQTINFRQISGLFILCAMLFFCFWRPYDPNSVYPEHSLEQPSGKHVFGTDRLGRDMYSRISSAVQSSVFRAGIAALASFFTAFVLAAVFALYLRKYKKIADLFRLVIRMLPPPAVSFWNCGLGKRKSIWGNFKSFFLKLYLRLACF